MSRPGCRNCRPVTLLWGETGTITPLSQAENLQRRILGAQIVRIPRAGHIPQSEAPELFQQALARILQDARPGRRSSGRP
ncbi:alpha/beta fold hydrolase [Pseudoduganella sp. HUAS MS19]